MCISMHIAPVLLAGCCMLCKYTYAVLTGLFYLPSHVDNRQRIVMEKNNLSNTGIDKRARFIAFLADKPFILRALASTYFYPVTFWSLVFSQSVAKYPFWWFETYTQFDNCLLSSRMPKF